MVSSFKSIYGCPKTNYGYPLIESWISNNISYFGGIFEILYPYFRCWMGCFSSRSLLLKAFLNVHVHAHLGDQSQTI